MVVLEFMLEGATGTQPLGKFEYCQEGGFWISLHLFSRAGTIFVETICLLVPKWNFLFSTCLLPLVLLLFTDWQEDSVSVTLQFILTDSSNAFVTFLVLRLKRHSPLSLLCHPDVPSVDLLRYGK